ncbi:unnamed protein product [Heterobilharzia americana]|nr:unnamed protein product [Heterobilharzia americana]
MTFNLTCFNAETDFTCEGILMYRFRAYVTPLIAIFGTTGNVLVLITFIIMQLKSPCRFNSYIIGITIAHIMELIFNAFLDDFLGRGLAWLSACNIIVKLDTYSQISCKFFRYIPEVSALISTNVLVLFSFDRILTVYHPIKFRGDRHLRPVHLGIISIYIIANILYLPTAINSDLVTSEENHTICQFVDPLQFSVQYNLYLSNIGATIIPTLVAIISTIIIIIKLHNIFKERDRMCQHGDRNANELRRISGHLAMTTMFFILNIPLITVVLLRQHSDYSNYGQLHPKYASRLKHLSKLFSSLKSLNSAIEFPTFFVFLPSFRSHLYGLFCGRHKPHMKDVFGLQRMRISIKHALGHEKMKSGIKSKNDKYKSNIKSTIAVTK